MDISPIVSFHKYDKIFSSNLYGRLKWLAILNAHTDRTRIFYLLLEICRRLHLFEQLLYYLYSFQQQNFGGYTWITMGWELAFVHSVR